MWIGDNFYPERNNEMVSSFLVSFFSQFKLTWQWKLLTVANSAGSFLGGDVFFWEGSLFCFHVFNVRWQLAILCCTNTDGDSEGFLFRPIVGDFCDRLLILALVDGFCEGVLVHSTLLRSCYTDWVLEAVLGKLFLDRYMHTLYM